jgi:HSP20 family molecular chaperone IbpA
MTLSSSNLISLATLWMGALSAGAERQSGTWEGCDYGGSNKNDMTILVKDLVSVPTYPNSLMRPKGRTWAHLEYEKTDSTTPSHFDILEDSNERVQFKMEVPGLSIQGLNVELENDRVLRVRGSRTQYKQGNYISQSEFDESIRLGDNVDVGHLQVKLSSGVLTITAPKKPTKMKRLPILADNPADILNPRMRRRKDEDDGRRGI